MTVCFLMPVYPPHFQFANEFIRSFEKFSYSDRAEVCLIFTNDSERAQFTQDTGIPVKKLTLPENLRNFQNNGIINVKKVWALSCLVDSSYEYIIVIDAETRIVADVDIVSLCDRYLDNKILLGNAITSVGRELTESVKESCKRFFVEHSRLSALQSDLYLWFNQPCIYKTDTLAGFLRLFESPGRSIFDLTWHDFDYYIYMYYLILEYEFRIVDVGITSNYGALEGTNISPIRLPNKKNDWLIMMCAASVMKTFSNVELFLAIHIDRDDSFMLHDLHNRVFELENRPSNDISDLEYRVRTGIVDFENRNSRIIIDLEERLNSRLEELDRELEKIKLKSNPGKLKKQIDILLSPFIHTQRWIGSPFRIARIIIKSYMRKR